MRRTGWKGGQAADVLFVNATIWTGDVRQPWAHSMAVANGRILSLGDSPEVQMKKTYIMQRASIHYVQFLVSQSFYLLNSYFFISVLSLLNYAGPGHWS